MRILKQSHSGEKLRRNDPLGFLKLQFAAKYSKNLKGDTLKSKKSKKSHSAEKNQKGDPLVSFGFVCNVRKGKTKGGTLRTNSDSTFGGICLVEQTEQKFRRFESVLN